MGRIVQTGDTPAKRRNAHTRSCAEVLRLLAQRPELADGQFDTEAQDMVAFLVFNLQGMHETIEQSAQAWDDRNYWKKSEALRAKYRWTRLAAGTIEELALAGRWGEVTPALIALLPHFAGVTIQQVTRDADWWCGAMRALRREAASREAAPTLL
jgi:acyl-homoserine lactone acylase PvdQ